MLFVRLKEKETLSKQPVWDVNIGDDTHQHYEKLDMLRQQADSEHEALCRLQTEYDAAQQEMKLLLEALDKHYELLDSVESQRDGTIAMRRQDIEVQYGDDCVIEFTRAYGTSP